ncbi:trafficking protein particle complex subunit 11-like [Chenopodium quinoa]|uniref:trafficking protein particle complex subunit 11-like n=1 Tax=Chenopodium quinoa TaxID=63459 RepID=UPI000B787B43|nr:trafficking protein particle complex subunit 11-like [Chenopodium quinoa]
MEEYPEELRTPPVPLITLVGCSELHPTISAHLNAEKPPINTLALPDFDKISVFAKPIDSADSSSSPPAGILKRDWLLKHRTKIPSVAVALFSSDHVSGDPSQWLQLSTLLDHLKTVIRTRNTKLVVVVVQTSPEDDMNEDRMAALRKRVELDSKYVVNFSMRDSSEVKQSLNRLGSVLADLIHIYYREEGRRVKTRVEKRNFNSAEVHIRCCVKVAVYAEFRRDWVEALKFYEDAYHALREMVGTSTRLPAIQRLIEIKTLAEQLHFKISTLLLHGGKIVEAILWFRQHCTSYKKLVGTAEATFLHWEWLSRQFLVFAELLETSSKNLPALPAQVSGVKDKALTEWELQPAYYYQLASRYLIEKRSCLELALSMWEIFGESNNPAESVIPSAYVGQFARLLEQGHEEVALQPLTDEEFIRYSIAEGKRFQDSFEIIALLKKSYEVYAGLKFPRMASYCSFHIAKEYFSLGEIKNAKQYFDSAVKLYRHESWTTLLWEILGYLRECASQDGSLKEFLEYSLEMAALPITSGGSTYKDCGPAGPPSFQQREIIHKEILGLVTGESEFALKGADQNLRVTKDSPLHIEIDLVSPLRVVLLASVAFHEQLVKPGMPTQFTLSLLSQLPLPFEIDSIDVQFNQSECNFVIQNSQKTSSPTNFTNQAGYRVETAPALALSTNKWLRLTYDVKSDRSGKLDCISIIVRIGSHFTICCRAESPASMDDLPLWKFEERLESFPTKDPAQAFSGQKAIQVEEPDAQVDLSVDADGPALIGENFIVPVTISSKGHSVYSGELKINLVDTRGGGLVSPREFEPHSTESHHVELLGVSGPGDENSLTTSDNIRNIQHSFGLISVPFLNGGESWSCKLEIKWHRPKPIMLYVSLSYSSQGHDVNMQKIHVHKSLQIEGQTPVLISHHMMLPFRRDALLLSRVKPPADAEKMPCLPLNETSILVLSAKNCTEVPLRVLSMTIEKDYNSLENFCTVHPASNQHTDAAPLNIVVPGEEYKKVFSVIPVANTPRTRIGTVCLKWMRDTGSLSQGVSGVLTKHKLPDANIEPSPLIVSLKCPPHGVLGDPFTYFIIVQNQTELLQEIKYSLLDSQSFVSSGSHNDTIFVLPKSEHILSYKLVPLASGAQQLPRVTVTSSRYSATFQPSVAASTIFVFPVKPQFEMKTMEYSAEPMMLAAE